MKYVELIALIIELGPMVAIAHEGRHHSSTEAPDRSPASLERLIQFPGSDGLECIQNIIDPDSPSASSLIDLGWAFISRARRQQTEARYQMALDACDIHDVRFGIGHASLFLRGHALLQLHGFAETESIARRLTRHRGLPEDHGLLGDALLEQGKLVEAATHYTRFARAKTNAQSLSRLAWLRWLQGKPDESLTLWQQAVESAKLSPREEISWYMAKLAEAHLRNGNIEQAERWTTKALAEQPTNAVAAFVRVQSLWALGAVDEAFERAMEISATPPLPERLWWQADVLREQGKLEAADSLRQRIRKRGHLWDPRGAALYLAYHTIDLKRARQLAEQELADRQDAMSLAIHALCAAKNDDLETARVSIENARRSEIRDSRIDLIAAQISYLTGNYIKSLYLANRAQSSPQRLTLTEIEVLNQLSSDAEASISNNATAHASAN